MQKNVSILGNSIIRHFCLPRKLGRSIAFALMVAQCVAGVAVANAADFNVKSYGAVGDGKHDDAPAFRKAIHGALASKPPATVIVPYGRYRLANTEQVKGTWDVPPGKNQRSAPYQVRAHLIINGAHHFSLSGEQGTTLLMGDPAEGGIAVVASSGVTLRNLAIDYDPLPFTQGRVLAVNRVLGTFDFKVDPGYGEPNGKIYRGKDVIWRVAFFDPDTRLYDFRVPFFKIAAAEQLAPDTWRLKTPQRGRAFAQLSGGKLAVVMSRRNGRPAVRFFGSKDSLVDNVSIHASPAGAFNLTASEAITLRNCAVAPPKGTNRLLSTAADGVHVKDNRRGPTIESCRFVRQGDDSINTDTGLISVLAQQTPDTILLNLPRNAKSGDRLHFIDGATGVPLGTIAIREVELAKWNDETVLRAKLQSAFRIPSTVTSMGLRRSDPRPPIKRPASERKLPTLAIDLDLASAGTSIRNSFFSDHLGRGILMRSSNAVIENNTFEHLMGPGIIAGFELNFAEGPSVENLAIRGNSFTDVALANVLVANTGMGNYPLLEAGYENRSVTIEKNKFSKYGAKVWLNDGKLGQVITVSNAENVRIVDNTIGLPREQNNQPLILLGLVRDVSVQGQKVMSGQRPAPKVIKLGTGADKQSIRISQ